MLPLKIISVLLSIVKTKKTDAEPSNTEIKNTITRHIDHQIKNFRKQYDKKYMHSKIPISINMKF